MQSSNGLCAQDRLDHRQAKPNCFASRCKAGSPVVTLDPDTAQARTTRDSVNAVERALL